MSRIPGLTSLVVNGVLDFMRKNAKEKTPQKRIVCLSALLLILGIIGFAPFFIVAVTLLFFEDARVYSLMFFLFSLLGGSMIIGFVNCRIYYDDNGFISKNLFGIKRKYTYDQVTAIKENVHEKYIYLGKRRVMIDEFSVGGEEFIGLVKKKYSTLHGKRLPKIYKTRYDIFNGNVNDSGIYIGIILGYVITISFAIFVACFTLFSPSTTSNTIENSVTFVSCDVIYDEIVMITEDNQLYKVRFIDEEFNLEAIESVCDGERIVTTYSEKVSPDNKQPYFAIKAIMYENNYILSFEETNELHIKEYWPLNIFSGLQIILWTAFVVGAVIVGRNPRKFSKRVVKFFFKDGSIRY